MKEPPLNLQDKVSQKVTEFALYSSDLKKKTTYFSEVSDLLCWRILGQHLWRTHMVELPVIVSEGYNDRYTFAHFLTQNISLPTDSVVLKLGNE